MRPSKKVMQNHIAVINKKACPFPSHFFGVANVAKMHHLVFAS